MTDKNNGGPAFPLQSISPEHIPGYSGMTLRDYFAAKAMQGFAACDIDWSSTDAMAAAAYRWADTMIAARMK